MTAFRARLYKCREDDGRERLLRVSPEGRRFLLRSHALWEKAQEKVVSEIGASKLKHWRAALETAEQAVATALERH